MDIGPPQIIVLADDLSGAAELAGIAFARGLTAEVRRVGSAHHLPTLVPPSAGPPADVIAFDTDSRHLPAADTAKRVRQVTQRVLELHPARLFKKVDSVLRGNVRAEIEAILLATGQPRALLMPANPSRNRVVSAGRYLVDGIPLDQTHFANDPDHPRRSADVQSLLGPIGDHPLFSISADSTLPSEGIIVPDITTHADLQNRTTQIDSTTLAAGAADFFAALLDHLHLPPHAKNASNPPSIMPPALLVCGSRAAWPTRRAACLAAGVPFATIEDGENTIESCGAFMLGIGDQDLQAPGATLLSLLSRAAVSIIRHSAVKTVLAEGGATAAALAEQSGWSRFTVAATAPAGVGVLRPITVQPAPLFLIKPGSYPWPSEIWNAFYRCHHERLV